MQGQDTLNKTNGAEEEGPAPSADHHLDPFRVRGDPLRGDHRRHALPSCHVAGVRLGAGPAGAEPLAVDAEHDDRRADDPELPSRLLRQLGVLPLLHPGPVQAAEGLLPAAGRPLRHLLQVGVHGQLPPERGRLQQQRRVRAAVPRRQRRVSVPVPRRAHVPDHREARCRRRGGGAVVRCAPSDVAASGEDAGRGRGAQGMQARDGALPGRVLVQATRSRVRRQDHRPVDMVVQLLAS